MFFSLNHVLFIYFQIIKRTFECPECRHVIDESKYEDLPVSYITLEILRYMLKNNPTFCSKTSKTSLPLKGCWKHNGEPKLFYCTICSRFDCRICSVVEHSEQISGACKIVSADEGIDIIKQSIFENISVTVNKVLKVFDKRDQMIKHLNDKIQVEEKYISWLQEKIKNRKERINQFNNDITNFGSITDQLQPELNDILDSSSFIKKIINSKDIEREVNEFKQQMIKMRQKISDVQIKMIESQPFMTLVSFLRI